MEHIARNAAKHVIQATYGLQYNCGNFKLEYVSNSIFVKIPAGRLVLRVSQSLYVTFSTGFITRITVAKETS